MEATRYQRCSQCGINGIFRKPVGIVDNKPVFTRFNWICTPCLQPKDLSHLANLDVTNILEDTTEYNLETNYKDVAKCLLPNSFLRKDFSYAIRTATVYATSLTTSGYYYNITILVYLPVQNPN